MKNPYEVIATPDAEQDLVNLFDYISTVLLAPETARKYLSRLRKGMAELSYHAGITPLVEDEPWHSLGIRKTLIENFFCYYRIDEQCHKVYILSVIYARRDQLNALANTKKANN